MAEPELINPIFDIEGQVVAEGPETNLRVFVRKDGTKVIQQIWVKRYSTGRIETEWRDLPEVAELLN